MMQAPVHLVDLEPFRQGDRIDQDAVARLVDDACRDTGFLQVTGHGVPLDECDRLLDTWAGFFDLPLAEKRTWVVGDESANRGFSELGKEALAYSRGERTPPISSRRSTSAGRRSPGRTSTVIALFAPNLWPDGHPASGPSG